MSKRTALYIRASSRDQVQHGFSIPDQLARRRHKAKLAGETIVSSRARASLFPRLILTEPITIKSKRRRAAEQPSGVLFIPGKEGQLAWGKRRVRTRDH